MNRYLLWVRNGDGPGTPPAHDPSALFFLLAQAESRTPELEQTLREVYAELVSGADGHVLERCMDESFAALSAVVAELEWFAAVGALRVSRLLDESATTGGELELPDVPGSGDTETPPGGTGGTDTGDNPVVRFQVRVVDGNGRPVDGWALEIAHQGRANPVTTGGDGTANLETNGVSFASVTVLNIPGVREKLRALPPSIAPAPTGPNVVTRPISDPFTAVQLESDVLTTIVLVRPFVGARLGSQASVGKTFPKPSMLPALRLVAERMTANPELQGVVMGHTDRTGADWVNTDISRNRAVAAIAALTGDAAYFRARFNGPDPIAPWGWEEIQWMLSAITVGGGPCYAAVVDGHLSSLTRQALKLFQISRGLPPHGQADDPTLEALIAAYLALVGERRPVPDRLRALGGGAWHPPRTFGPESEPIPVQEDGADPARRRVEVFLCEGPVIPPPETCPAASHPVCLAYEAWCRAVNDDLQPSALGAVAIRVIDDDGVAMAGQGLELAEHTEDELIPLGTVSTDALGIIRLTSPPGFYSLALTAAGETLRASFVLHRDEQGSATLRFPVRLADLATPSA